MFLEIEKPYIKAYKDDKNRVRYFVYTDNSAVMLDFEHIGELLLQFVMADLSAYKIEVDTITTTVNSIVGSRNDDLMLFTVEISIYSVCDKLLEICPVSRFYLHEKLNEVFKSEKEYVEKLVLASSFLNNILVLQQIFQTGIEMCCDVDFEKPLESTTASFLAFSALHPDFMNYHLITGVGCAPLYKGKIDFDMVDFFGKNEGNSLEFQKELLRKIDTVNPDVANITEYVLLKDFTDFLYFEFTELIKRGLRARKCKNCGKYFVLRTKHETMYCDRKNADGKTCKAIGNKKAYLEKLQNDELLHKYERMYKAAHAKRERLSESETGFDRFPNFDKSYSDWSNNAKKMRADYIDGSISRDDFEKWLINGKWQP